MEESSMSAVRWIVFCLIGSLAMPAILRGGTVTPLHDGWRLQSACKVQAGGEAISAQGFSIESWLPTSVPSTVLAAQVANKVFPDPFFGMNLRQIPGEEYPIGRNFMRAPMPTDSPYRCAWWYRTEFKTPAPSRSRDRFFLHFDGINYRANIWLNGHQIANSKAVAGTYRTYDFDVTSEVVAGKPNVLAVETFAPGTRSGRELDGSGAHSPGQEHGPSGPRRSCGHRCGHGPLAHGGHALYRRRAHHSRLDRLRRVVKRHRSNHPWHGHR
jgi:exo-1,4-beta-D-glucosaminidase